MAPTTEEDRNEAGVLAKTSPAITNVESCKADFEDLIHEYNGDNEEQQNEGVNKKTDDDSDTCSIDFPLAIRALPPHCHTIATWNVNNGFSVDAISIIMHRFNVSVIFIQEPMVQNFRFVC